MSTISRFADGLKAKLRKEGSYDWASLEGWETSGYYVEIEWDELDAAIDKFCAEFKAKQNA